METVSFVLQVWSTWLVASSWQLAILVAMVAVAAACSFRLPARFRYALWLLVLLKVFTPPSLTAPWSPVNWVESQIAAWCQVSPARSAAAEPSPEPSIATAASPYQDAAPVPARLSQLPALGQALESNVTRIWFLWATGAAFFLAFVIVRYHRMARLLRRATVVEEGPLRIALERLALRVSDKPAPELLLSDHVSSPFLLGLFRVRIVLPAGLSASFSQRELENVLLHELLHWRRHDALIGWIQVVVQALFWFHPLVWYANAELRHERENACDEAALQTGCTAPEQYGESLLQVLLAAQGRSSATLGFLGIFERNSRLQRRLQNIMSQGNRFHGLGLWKWLILLVFALVVFPMSGAQNLKADAGTNKKDIAPAPNPYMPPKVISSSPTAGATDVDPAITEISVTFDHDMDTSGYSWTGGGEFFPKIPSGTKPFWRDARTCVLPVSLVAGHFYRVGINAASYQSFRTAGGPPADPVVICFTTAGASEGVVARLRAPRVVGMEPANGADAVDPALSELRVTFDQPMGSGFSWCGGGPEYPETDPDKGAFWTADQKTCVLPVRLQANHSYSLNLNAQSFNSFQTESGVPLSPVVWTFKTK